MGDHAVAAEPFGPVQRNVGQLNQLTLGAGINVKDGQAATAWSPIQKQSTKIKIRFLKKRKWRAPSSPQNPAP